VDLEDVHLCEADERSHRVDDQILADFCFLPDADAPNRRRSPHPGVLHEHAVDALPGAAGRDAFRTVDQRQRPIDEVGQHPFGDRVVIPGEVELGDAGGGKEHAIRV